MFCIAVRKICKVQGVSEHNLTGTCQNVVAWTNISPNPFLPPPLLPLPPPPLQKKSFGLYTVLLRNLQNLFIPPEHLSAKLIVNVYLKKPKTTFSSDDASG